MQKTYTISKDSKEMGPFTVEQILLALSSGDIAITDFIYSDEAKDWISLLDFKPVVNQLKSKKPSAAPSVDAKSVEASAPKTNDEEWFLLREDKKLGPFSYLNIVKMLQDKEAYEFDFVWNDNMTKWTRIAELREFSPERISAMIKDHKDVFLKRGHKRIDYQSDIMVSDAAEIFNGSYLQISEGGARVKIAYSMLAPGDKVVIHHRGTNDLAAFNAACEIVNKTYSQTIRNKKQEVEYIVKFMHLNDTAKKSIHDLTKKVS
ncbi:MAG: DUF4339 domain-containing protein [Bdellovibrionales bacterium]|nr:DUF4339 domain-containing protein [Bdellovibrionales bacterium]